MGGDPTGRSLTDVLDDFVLSNFDEKGVPDELADRVDPCHIDTFLPNGCGTRPRGINRAAVSVFCVCVTSTISMIAA